MRIVLLAIVALAFASCGDTSADRAEARRSEDAAYSKRVIRGAWVDQHLREVRLLDTSYHVGDTVQLPMKGDIHHKLEYVVVR